MKIFAYSYRFYNLNNPLQIYIKKYVNFLIFLCYTIIENYDMLETRYCYVAMTTVSINVDDLHLTMEEKFFAHFQNKMDFKAFSN